MQRTVNRASLGAALAVMVIVAACGGGGPATPTPAAPTPAATQAAATAGAAPTATSGATGPASITAPDQIEAGKQFDVTFTGPNGQGDYITIVKAGTAKWTTEPWFYTSNGSPGKLTAPSADGSYVLWYVSGADSTTLAQRPITVLAFSGDLLAPDSVMGGSQFDVAWNGPNGPGDYVTIVKVGTAKWTNESWFYTSNGSPGKLTAAIEAGAYEIWYVVGSDSSTKARRPITVTPVVITLDAPKSVARNSQFQVTWTGPNGPSDYVTIVPAGSAPGTYTNYAYTASGSPATLTAPDKAGDYEIWYASDRISGTLAHIAIKVT